MAHQCYLNSFKKLNQTMTHGHLTLLLLWKHVIVKKEKTKVDYDRDLMFKMF
jgi:hypothetical protein